MGEFDPATGGRKCNAAIIRCHGGPTKLIARGLQFVLIQYPDLFSIHIHDALVF